MTADESGFLATILSEPDDNTHRLVYADWLDEYGTTDQQKARSEWIRMTCWDRGQRARRPTGERTRGTGEPDWLRSNARRLWPNLFAAADGTRRPVYVGLATGVVAITVPLRIRASTAGLSHDLTVVNLAAERGVTRFAGVTFVRAARVAPAVAADEPAVRIRLQALPRRLTPAAGAVDVPRRPFALRGLGDVWERLAAEERAVGRERVKVITRTGRAGLMAEAKEWIDDALTKWAREEATILPAFGGDRA